MIKLDELIKYIEEFIGKIYKDKDNDDLGQTAVFLVGMMYPLLKDIQKLGLDI